MSRTAKTLSLLSTVSYNSSVFLQGRLNELLQSGDIIFWAYIYHFAEEDETKPHYHVLVEPGCPIDMRSLSPLFKEFDPKAPGKLPLGCLPFRKSSKFQDWYLYAVHDRGYLATKRDSFGVPLTRKYHYSFNDIICSDVDDLREKFHLIDWSKVNPLQDMIYAAESGIEFKEFCKMRPMTPSQAAGLLKLYSVYFNGHGSETFRGGRSGHELDVETGEVL